MKPGSHLSDTAGMQIGAGKLSLGPRTGGGRETARLSLARFFNWASSSRSHRVVCLLIGVWLISAFDLVLTVAAHDQGLLHESNPIAARILPHGAMAIAAYKIVLLALPSVVLFRNRDRVLTEIASAGVLVIYAIVAVQWRLCYELYTLTSALDIQGGEIHKVHEFLIATPFL